MADSFNNLEGAVTCNAKPTEARVHVHDLYESVLPQAGLVRG